MNSLIVEGWRGINQSYAMVNQYQLRELRKHHLRLFHRDQPYYNPNWSPVHSDHGFPSAIYEEIANIPSPPDDLIADAIYRISAPLRLNSTSARKLYVFGTSEYQNIDDYITATALRQGLENPDLTIVTPSRWSAEGFYRAGFDESQVVIIPHGVDPELFKPPGQESREEFRRALKIEGHEFAILSVGAMTTNKGIETLIIAYALLRQRYPHIRLILKDQASLYGVHTKDIVNHLKLAQPRLVDDRLEDSIVHLSQSVSLTQLRGLYGAADCYASPYLAEGFNLPPLEAAACGTPIVVTRYGATDDYVDPSFALQIDGTRMTDGTNYWIKPNLDSLVTQLTALVENMAPQINKTKALAFIANNFSWYSIVNRLVKAMAQ